MTLDRDRLWRVLIEGVLWLLVLLALGGTMFTLVYFGRQSL